jgi:hypothetical protein
MTPYTFNCIMMLKTFGTERQLQIFRSSSWVNYCQYIEIIYCLKFKIAIIYRSLLALQVMIRASKLIKKAQQEKRARKFLGKRGYINMFFVCTLECGRDDIKLSYAKMLFLKKIIHSDKYFGRNSESGSSEGRVPVFVNKPLEGNFYYFGLYVALKVSIRK